MKMWQGFSSGETAKIADEFNSSIGIDSRMFRQDIKGSVAHAEMLCAAGIISERDAAEITTGLADILSELESGKLAIDESCEDIHMFVEQELSRRFPESGKKLHTARSRNDQVALDLRMHLMEDMEETAELTKAMIKAIVDKASECSGAVMAGYTHLQWAQPVLLSHHLLAYAWMLKRDIERISDCKRRTAVSPIGSCALAGTTYNIDREFEASLLGFCSITENSIDAVSDRDFCIEYCACLSIEAMHLSRLAEECVIWSSGEFSYLHISDAYTTGSSIMPQKKNPDMAELARGKSARVFGDLMSLLSLMKALPLAYNKDMQEDKEAVFDAAESVQASLKVLTGMISECSFDTARMRENAAKGYINATDLADYLVGKGMPFRSAYKLSGEIVGACFKKGKTLEELPLEDYRAFSELFAEDVYGAVDLNSCVERRNSLGGTSPCSVDAQLAMLRAYLSKPEK